MYAGQRRTEAKTAHGRIETSSLLLRWTGGSMSESWGNDAEGRKKRCEQSQGEHMLPYWLARLADKQRAQETSLPGGRALLNEGQASPVCKTLGGGLARKGRHGKSRQTPGLQHVPR